MHSQQWVLFGLMAAGGAAVIGSYVWREVGRLKRELGKGGGFILGPAITVQGDAPVELVIAMIEEARGDRGHTG